jgi:DNA-binding transcriptional MerR regulator
LNCPQQRRFEPVTDKSDGKVSLLKEKLDSKQCYCNIARMEKTRSLHLLADEVNRWCDAHSVAPANGQAGERITERSVRFYRTLGLVDAPRAGGGEGYGEKHRLQLVAVRLLQAQGLPLRRIRDLLFGRSLQDLQRIERQGLAELKTTAAPRFQATAGECWGVTPLDDEFILISRRGRSLSPELRSSLLDVLCQSTATTGRLGGQRKENDS